MKLLLDNGLLLDVEAPILPTESYMDADGRVLWRVQRFFPTGWLAGR